MELAKYMFIGKNLGVGVGTGTRKLQLLLDWLLQALKSNI